jgi:hypothetical protein
MGLSKLIKLYTKMAQFMKVKFPMELGMEMAKLLILLGRIIKESGKMEILRGMVSCIINKIFVFMRDSGKIINFG